MSETLKERTSSELQAMFINAVSEHKNSGQSESEVNKANDAANLMRYIYHELRSRADGPLTLRNLLDSDDPHVQIWAAPFGFNHFPEHTESVLKLLRGHDSGRIRGDAKQILDWREMGILVTE